MQRKSSSSVQIFYPKYRREEIIKSLCEKVRILHRILPLKSALLFGSYAMGNFTVASDIDVLIVYRGQENKKAYSLAKKILDLPQLEPHVYSEPQSSQMAGIIGKMSKKGIILFS